MVIDAGIFDSYLYPISSSPRPLIPVPDELLKSIDLGISGVDREQVEISSLRLNDDQESGLQSITASGSTAVIELLSGRFEISRQHDGALVAHRLRLIHDGPHGSYALEWNEESDGTKTVLPVLDLFVLLAAGKSSLILVIDEIDRSFHTELSRALIDGFLNSCSRYSRSQLIFTTHDLLLMDPERLRRNEMWITEKDGYGGSELIGITEYRDVRKDSDLRKNYLAGRFGGVPNIPPLKLENIITIDPGRENMLNS